MARRIDSLHPYTPSRGVVAGQTFRSWSTYKRALAQAHGFSSHEARRRRPRILRTQAELAGARPEVQDADRRAKRALALMRDKGLPLNRAASDADTTPGNVLRHVGRQGLRKEGRRYRATKRDSLLRVVWVPGRDGTSRLVALRDSRDASRLGRYNNDAKRALRYHRQAELDRWRGVRIGGIELPTDLTEVRRMEDAGLFDYDSLYEPPA